MPDMNRPAPASQRILQPAPGVIARDMGGAAVLIHLDTNRIFELNTTGARVWALIQEGRTRDQIVTTLRTEFAAGAEVESTVDDLLDHLGREKLIDG